jgi:hypothetical protein
MKTDYYQQLSVRKKQRLCLYCETHNLCNGGLIKDRLQEKGNGCYVGFTTSRWTWCSAWVQFDNFKIALITRSKNESS